MAIAVVLDALHRAARAAARGGRRCSGAGAGGRPRGTAPRARRGRHRRTTAPAPRGPAHRRPGARRDRPDGRRPRGPRARPTPGSTRSSTARRGRPTRAARARPGGRRPDRLGDGRRGARARDRPGRARDGGDRLRRPRGQGGQELHRHGVPLRLPQGQAVGRGDRRGRRARDPVRRRADRRRPGAAADHQPDLDRAVQVDRRGQDAQRGHLPPVGARRALRARARSSCCRRPARRPGCRRTRCRSSPTRRSRPRSTSSTTPASTSSGPPAARRPSRRRTRPASRASAWAPATRRSTCTRSADVPMAVVDVLISKTFDASVICPAEQTLVVDDAIYDELVAELERMGARVLGRRGGRRARRASPSTRTAAPAWRRSGARASTSPRWPASTRRDARQGPRRAAARPTSRSSPRHPLLHEKLMPVLGLVRSPSVEHAHRRLRARHRARRPRPHVGDLRRRRGRSIERFAAAHPHGPHPRQRPDGRRRARRHLQPR